MIFMLAVLEIMRVDIFSRDRIKAECREYTSHVLCKNRPHGKEIDDLHDIGGGWVRVYRKISYFSLS